MGLIVHTAPGPRTLLGLLASEERLRTFAAVVLGAATPEEAAATADLPLAAVHKAIARLERGGLIATTGGHLTVSHETLTAAARSGAEHPPKADRDPLDRFVREGRLLTWPARPGDRLLVLGWLAGLFEPGVRYTEPEVNAVLQARHPDFALLRRYLVDEGLLARAHHRGEGPTVTYYWRTGDATGITPHGS